MSVFCIRIRASKMIKGLGYLTFKEMLRELIHFNLKKRRLRCILLMCMNT